MLAKFFGESPVTKILSLFVLVLALLWVVSAAKKAGVTS